MPDIPRKKSELPALLNHPQDLFKATPISGGLSFWQAITEAGAQSAAATDPEPPQPLPSFPDYAEEPTPGPASQVEEPASEQPVPDIPEPREQPPQRGRRSQRSAVTVRRGRQFYFLNLFLIAMYVVCRKLLNQPPRKVLSRPAGQIAT